MKTFFKNSVFFLLGLLIISFIIQSIVFALIKNLEVGELGVINKIMNGQINTEILICGASRAFVGINPKIIEEYSGMSCYNIALNGSRLGLQVPLLKAYLKHNKKPKILIQELGMYSLSVDKKVFAPYKFLPYLQESEIYEGLLKIDHRIWLNKFIPLMNLTYFNTNFQSILIKDYKRQLNKLGDYLIDGFHKNKNQWSIDEKGFFKNPHGIYNKIEHKGIQLLDEIIQICKENNIKLVLVNTPEYYKILNLYKHRDEIIKVFENKAKENDLKYLDYTEHEMTKNRNNFYNFTHLNARGANKFTNILCKNFINNKN